MRPIAEHMKDIMLERKIRSVGYGSLDEIHECARRSGMHSRVKTAKGTNPLRIMNKVLDALDRSSLFQKHYVKYIGRPARSFKLK